MELGGDFVIEILFIPMSLCFGGIFLVHYAFLLGPGSDVFL